MISAGVEGQIPPYMMTYPERWGAQKQEFVRPAPKPLPTRFNGASNNAPNGTRVGHSARPLAHHQPPAATPVNLTQHKDEIPDQDQYFASRVFPPPNYNHYHPFPGLYSPYPQLLRATNYVPPPPLSPLDTYSPTTPTGNGSFLSPQVPTFSPPTGVKTGQQTSLRDKVKSGGGGVCPPPSFKVPSGKEGSLKHRILTRPEDVPAPISSLEHLRETRKRIASARVVSPPRSPAKPLNNNVVSAKFTKGSLIQLADGKVRNVEDMRTEDFVLSAEMSPELRLAESTVIKIEENPITGTATITLTYNDRRAKVEVEAPLDHPFFVIGRGWASCNVDRTLQSYGLKVYRLHVGDVLISLTPRETAAHHSTGSTTVTTSSTMTAVHHQQQQQQLVTTAKEHQHLVNNLIKSKPDNYHNNAHHAPMSPDSMRKRRWSAPDQICDEEEQQQQQQQAARRMRVE